MLPVGNMAAFDRKTIDAGVYTFARVASQYIQNNMRVMLPYAKKTSGRESQSVNVGQCLSRRVFHYHAERVRSVPEAPAPVDSFIDDNGIEYWLLDFWTEIPASRVASDGIAKVYAVEAVYVYGMSRKIQAGDNMSIGSLPFQAFTERIKHDDIFTIQDGLKR